MNKGIENLIKMALAEDIGPGDITTDAVIPKEQKAKAVIIAKESGVIAGLPLVQLVFQVLDKKIKFIPQIKDGHKVKKGKIIAQLSGPARSILGGERLALNFLQRASGIATLTKKFRAKIPKLKAKILDTRKTIPLWRGADKHAVLAGGGNNHRFGLYDGILIKDNHIKLAGLRNAVRKAKEKAKAQDKVEVEAKTISEVKQAISAQADRILLDNMPLKQLRKAVKLCKKAGIETEASGGINLKNVTKIARTGVDYISIGELTHSPRALDVSLEII